MFEYPLPLPTRTLYRELGVSPDASDEEIRRAKAESIRRFSAEQADLVRDIESIRNEVPGLKSAVEEVDRLRAAEDAKAALLATARARLDELERAAVARDSGYRQKCEQIDALTRRIEDLNRSSIDKPEARLTYDQSQPPLALLRLVDCTRDAFVESRTALFLVRRELSDWFDAHGVNAFHPSDLTRNDFSADFQPNLLLDKER